MSETIIVYSVSIPTTAPLASDDLSALVDMVTVRVMGLAMECSLHVQGLFLVRGSIVPYLSSSGAGKQWYKPYCTVAQ